jgi:hypothetical protein
MAEYAIIIAGITLLSGNIKTALSSVAGKV